MLVSNWKTILSGAWSAWLMYASLILTVLEGVFPGLKDPLGLSDVMFSAINGFIIAAALLARVLVQNGITPAKEEPQE